MFTNFCPCRRKVRKVLACATTKPTPFADGVGEALTTFRRARALRVATLLPRCASVSFHYVNPVVYSSLHAASALFIVLTSCDNVNDVIYRQLEPKSVASSYDGIWPYAPLEECPAEVQERLP